MSTNKESNSLAANIIYDCTPFTHLDYPDQLACIIWFSGCNMRCDYCYNKDIVFAKNGEHSFEDILTFLKSRKNLLDAVVLSGGEATTHNLIEFCQDIKEIGYKIKLDTNGTNPSQIKKLLELELLDYVALDYKAPEAKFKQITYSNKYKEFSDTLDMLIESSIEFEARTTLHNDLLYVEDINDIISDLKSRGYNNKYYLQEFLDTESNIGNIQASNKEFNKSLLNKDLETIFR